jgi:demethoxyubiquinone hydroxylase (CLK1/Coq7/Cat5 family)
MTEEDYDVVVDVLQKHYDKLLKMTQQNMNADMDNIMDQIRLEQCAQLGKAIIMWKTRSK